jgi:hypothetical protein
MRTHVLEIATRSPSGSNPDLQLSFRPFLDHLRARLKDEQSIKAQYYEFVIDKFEKQNAVDFSLENVEQYRELLEIIYFVLTPLVRNEQSLFWALGTPYPGKLFYTTDEFFDLYQSNLDGHDLKSGMAHVKRKKKHIGFIYGMILERFYGVTTARDEIAFPSFDPKTGLTKYYQVHADMQFVNVHVKGALPKLSYEDLKYYLQEGTEKEARSKLIEKILPLDLFKFEGFSVITLRDVTASQAIESIRDVLTNHHYDHEHMGQIVRTLKTLAGTRDIGFGLLPFLEVNGKPVIMDKEYFHSIVFSTAKKQGITGNMFEAFISDYRKKHRALIFHQLQKKESDLPFVNMLKDMKLESYALFPVKFRGRLTGVLEMYSKRDILFDEKIISRIQPAIPLLAQLLEYISEKFVAEIDDVVMEKFTPLQPSVQWKFKEAAWRHLQENKNNASRVEIPPVHFDHVYPLYGAIDIRNSTMMHAKAAQEDISHQLQVLKKTLEVIDTFSNERLSTTLDSQCDQWMAQMNEYFTTKDEITLNGFLISEVHPYLQDVQEKIPATSDAITHYFNAIAEPDGSAYKNRSELAKSMNLINASVNQYLETDQKELQNRYPFYFEKFRTDGIEYDIYVGESIAPSQKFNMQYLKDLRFWQLQSMAAITRITESLLPDMPTLLHTTQLIFVHSSPIDISFRNDERRFDVEGAYNIRYEVIKKRIDKAIIKGTEERLTQPNKIAIAYFNNAEQKEYLGYIQKLQEQDVIDRKVEYLELEELHGVSGIRALRVEVLPELAKDKSISEPEKKLATL